MNRILSLMILASPLTLCGLFAGIGFLLVAGGGHPLATLALGKGIPMCVCLVLSRIVAEEHFEWSRLSSTFFMLVNFAVGLSIISYLRDVFEVRAFMP